MNNFTASIRLLFIVILPLILNFFGFSQTKIAEITFESAGGYSTSILEFTNGTNDYFIRTNGTNTTSATFSNVQGSYYFAAQDIDANGDTLPLEFLWDNVNINGYSNLEFRVHLAEDDDGANQDWDSTDYVHFDYDIDNSGTFTELLWIESYGLTNTAPLIDTDYNGTGDGTEITETFTQFTQNITATGSLIDIQIEISLNSGDEDVAIDNIEIWGVSGSPTPTITATPSSLTGFTYIEGSGPSLEQDFNVSGSNLTSDILVTPPTYWEISTTSGGPYQITPITLTQSGGIVTSTTIYTRMVSGLLNTNSPFSGVILCSSSGATSQNVTVDGSVTLVSSDCAFESFDNSNATSSYGDNSYVGDNGLTWSYIESRDENGDANGSGINGNALMLRRNTDNSSVASSIVPNGIGDFSVKLYKGFTGSGNRQVELFVNGVSQGTSTPFDDFNEHIFSVTGINISGDVSVEIRNITGSQVIVDDIEWTCYNSCIPAHTISGFSPLSEAVGATVTIIGTGFTASSAVQFNGTSAITTFVNSTTLNATVPVGATTGVITVTESGCKVDSASDFTVLACSPAHSISGFAPTTGPELTEVTITGTGFTGSTTVEFGGISATIISQTTTQIVAEVPIGAPSGAITVTEAGCPLDSISYFTVLISTNCSLSGGMPTGFTDLLISGVYDDSVASCHYIELLNPTSSDIDLSSYALGFDNNFTLPSVPLASGFLGAVTLSGIIPAQSTYMVQVTTVSGGCSACPSITPDYVFEGSLGLNDEDRVVLVSDYGTGSAAVLDVWQNHSNGLGYAVGYVFARDLSSNAPTATFDNSDWILNETEDCFGFAISSTPPPTIDSQPTDVISCSTNTFSISASAGNGGALTYQWKYNDGFATAWSDVTSIAFSPGTVSGETSNSLTISGFNLEGYQFYCVVTEDSSCSVASDAAQFKVTTATWDGTSWSTGTAPTLTDVAVINGDYNSATFGSFSVCQLFVNSGYTLIVDNSTYVEVENDVVVAGEIRVETQGGFVQNNNLGSFVLDTSGVALVNKYTSTLNNWYDYTYWSSPTVNETVADGLDIAPASRRYYFDANNYLDVLAENNNDNTLVPGHDDIDDNGDDWQLAVGTSIMQPGVGYAATVSPIGFTSGTYPVSFEGEFNNGVITTPIAYNGANGDGDWNFIGNPYPCALNCSTFFSANAGIVGGSIYLWSHYTAPSETSNGNQMLNFSQADYAIITQSGVNVAGASSIIPDDYIPSGQGFFVQGLVSGLVTFNNSMRMADVSSNNQFFRTSGIQNKNIVWINLRSNNGAFNQVAIGYHDVATNEFDGYGFDATRNLSTGQGAIIYTKIDGSDKKFAIQAKAAESFVDEEAVPLGLKNTINTENTEFTLSIDQVKGVIMEKIPIYLKDNLMGIEHELSKSEYTFTSNIGEFNDRFEVVFKISEELITDILETDKLIVLENQNQGLDFSTTLKSDLSSITIYDLLGRQLAFVEAKNKQQQVKVNLKFISAAVYIAKVFTADGRTFTKKIVME